MKIRTCWICYAEEEIEPNSTEKNDTDEDFQESSITSYRRASLNVDSDEDSKLKWIRPCRCRGDLEYVHKKCFKIFILHSRSGNKCAQCKTKYTICIKDYYFIKFYETITSFCLGSLFVIAVMFLCLGIYILLFLYGAALTYTTLGKTTITNLIFKKGQNDVELNYSGIARILLGFPLFPISLVFTKPYITSMIIQIILFILIIEINSPRIQNFIIAFIPILYLVYKFSVDALKERLVPNSRSYFTERSYTINSFLAQFPFAAKTILISLFIPFASSFVGYLFFPKVHYLRTVLGAFSLFIVIDTANILYLYLIKRRMEGLTIEEN